MKDIVQEALSDYDIATIGRRGKDSADDDDAGMSGRDFGDSKLHPAQQLKLIQNIDSQNTIKTKDGEEVEMDKKQATLIRSMIDGSMGPNTIAKMFKSSAVERMTAIVMDSVKLKKLLTARDAEEMKSMMAQMANLSASDRIPDKSIY